MGIATPILPAFTAPQKRGATTGELDFIDVWYPIPVKQKARVGRPGIDAFETGMEGAERTNGFFVAFGFSSEALTEIDRHLRKTGNLIIWGTVGKILDEQLPRKLA